MSSVTELKKQAKSLGIEKSYSMKKDELIRAIDYTKDPLKYPLNKMTVKELKANSKK